MSSITPFLWFDEDIREVIRVYQGVFSDLKLLSPVADTAPAGGAPEIASVEMHGQRFDIMSVAGKPGFSEGVSFVVSCGNQTEVDRYWFGLIADGGEESMCGWLKDRFCLSWQIVPTRLLELQSGPDPEAAARVTNAMLQMKRIVIADLEAAAEGPVNT